MSVNETAEYAISRAGTPTRFRAFRAYWLTLRILAGYAWLRLWRPVLGPSLYNARLVRRHRASSRRLVTAILELKGLFIKVGQLISILTNFLPPEFRSELEQLQDSVPARPLDEVVTRLRKQLGKSPEELFASFDAEPVASASLAQVHVARLHDGRKVAVKVQHADVEAIAKLDLEILRKVLDMIQIVVRLRGLEEYHADISQMIREELDFRQEARNIDTMRGNFANDPNVHFPVVVRELSSERVLTTEFVEGTKVTDFAGLDALGLDRRDFAQRFLRIACQMIFIDGVFHADPHPGNIIVHRDGSFTMLDLGAVGRMAPNVLAGCQRFFDGIIKRDSAQITAALHQAGFISRDPEVAEEEIAERAISYFQRRFLEQMHLESWSLKDIQFDMKTKLEAMADLRKLDISFRDLSRAFQVPKEWVLFERAALLTLGLVTAIDPEFNPIHTVGPYLQQFVLGKDTDWRTKLTTAVRDMAMSAVTIPDKTNRVLERATRGDLQFHITGLRESALLIYAGVHQVLFAFAAAALGVLAHSLDQSGRDVLSLAAWLASALCVLAVAGSIWRARALGRKLRAK